ncbi:MAG: sulfite exporter TauE/SafE family protein [Pyrinomonadaceae bacterium]
MKYPHPILKSRRAFALLSLIVFLSGLPATAFAHPLGNFTINHFTRLEVGAQSVRVHYVIDMAEIPTFQELPSINADGDSGTPTAAELDAYAMRAATDYIKGLRLSADGAQFPLTLIAARISLPAGQGGLPTLRLECDYTGELPAGHASSSGARRLNFIDANHEGRIGWHEIAVSPGGGVNVFNSSAFGNTLSNELREYPENMLAAPLNEREAALSFTTGAPPANAKPLVTRDGGKVASTRDRLAELIAVKDLTLGVALAGLLLAALLGGFHALSPGHGKTIVAAYLIGSRGTAKHAAFLGLTVTVTHTAGVFALGLVTLFAAQYIVPERLYPILGFISGAIVVAIGLSLLVRRIGAVFGYVPHEHEQHSHADGHTPHAHDYASHSDDDHEGLHSHTHEGESGLVHSHGGREHSHLPPGTDGGPVTWRSLLALGISGGLLPCPSALVVLLSAISFQRVGYGLLLVVSFSIGLASALTGIGLLFVYARRWMERPLSSTGVLVRVLPAFSAFAITCAGLIICYQAIGEAGYSVPGLGRNLLAQGQALFADKEPAFAQMSTLAVLGLGLVFGLKHATEVDHVVAVSSIVSEQGKLWRAALVGGLWGVGHTASLVIVGTVVLVLRVAIPERVASGLEFCVALMIIGLGVATLIRAARRRAPVHVHPHRHDGAAHAHIHFHETDAEHADAVAPHSHAVSRIGIKPLVVGAMHGLAGSAALTLLVLAQIPSTLLGLLYLAVFGLGSIAGMLLMSGLVGLPFVLSVRKLTGLHYGLQAGAGILSVCFGLWYAYETGIASGLWSGN